MQRDTLNLKLATLLNELEETEADSEKRWTKRNPTWAKSVSEARWWIIS